ncbi:MAG TPA: hypothetical protein VMV73_03430 [Candidatus Dormibacteraeota bacterium]|nr:hypothetical protein [Candidatus Dormibacteraeota bacterium]
MPRLFTVLALWGLLFIATLGTAAADSSAPLIHVAADRVAFSFNRYTIQADGHVVVRTSSGLVIRGQTFSMDLKLNRFLVAGHVVLQAGGKTQQGAAVSDYLQYDRLYVVPITGEPDRWTFINNDLTKPYKGLVMPGDVFYFANFGRARPFLTARSAVIRPLQYVRFADVRLPFLGVPLPLPTYYLNFSPNPNLAQNSLSGATYDLTYNYAGNEHSISALHLRYDSTNKGYLSFEQHLSGRNGYAVVSLNPATRPQKYWNTVLDYQPNQRLSLRTFTQLYTTQSWLSTPYAAAQFTFATLTYALPQSFLQLTASQTNYNLVGTNVASFNHPTSMQLTATSFTHRIGKLPLFENTFFGMGFNHDAIGAYGSGGLQKFGGVDYTTLWNHDLGFTLYTPSFRLGHATSDSKSYFLNASFTRARTYYTVPHYVDTASTIASISRQFLPGLGAYLSYQVQNVGDIYKVGGYTSVTPIINGVPYPSYAAFRGIATFRTLALGINGSPTPEFNWTILARDHRDFPIPEVGLFTFTPYNVLGNVTPPAQLGEPPYDITGDIRLRVQRHLYLEVQRSYFFHYGTNNWSPTFFVQFTP